MVTLPKQPRRLLLVLLFGLVLLIPIQQEPPATQAKPAKAVTFEGEAVIYVVGPMSGRDAEKGQAQAAGARLAAQEFNLGGGLLNQKIVIKVINDAGEQEGALAAAKKVAHAANSGEKIIGVVLHEGSDPQLGAVEAVYFNPDAGLNLMVVLPASTEPLPVDIADRRFFRLSAPNLHQASEIAYVFQERNLKDVVIVHSSTPYGNVLSKEFSKTTQSLDVRPIASFEIKPDATSYADVVSRVREINPAGLFFAGGDVEAGGFLSDLFGFEFQGVVFGSDRALSYTVIDELGCQAEGMNFISVLPDPEAVMGADRLASYEAAEGRTAEPYAVAGYSGIEFIVEAFKKAGSQDVKQASEEARKTKITTLMGEITFDSQGHVQHPKIHFFQVQCKLFRESFAREVGKGSPIGEKVTQKTLTTFLEVTSKSEKAPIVFAGLNWASAQFANSISRFIIESGFDHPTQALQGSSVPLFQGLREGDIHVFLEGWLPNMQELYEKALKEKQIVDLGLFYGDAVQGWFVPKYVITGDSKRNIKPVAPELKSVNDLVRYQNLFANNDQPGIGRLIDGSPGWFSYKINCMKLKAYRLDDKYAQITAGSESALFAELSQAYEKGEPILSYMYDPTWPMARFDLRRLDEPKFTQERWRVDKGCAYPLSQIKKFVHINLPQRAPKVAEFLRKLRLDSDKISRILLTMKERDLKPEEAALIWLRENENIWMNWVTNDVAQKVKQALNI
jgi:glycine betaine/proline transport system substrate-binding protein